MSQLVYRNPIVPGAPEDVRQLNECFEDVRVRVNGQLEGDNVAILPQSRLKTPSRPVWKRVWTVSCPVNGGASSQSRQLCERLFAKRPLTDGSGMVAMYQSRHTDHMLGGVPAMMRMGVNACTNATAPGSAFTVELGEISACNGLTPATTTLDTGDTLATR